MNFINNILNENMMKSMITCPNCGTNIMLPYQHFDFRISLIQIRGISGISIYKTITSTEGNQNILHDFCINSWKHQPFIAKVEQTTSYHNVITALIRQGLISPEELR